MGMGEPLANYDNLLKALRILNAPWGGGIGARKITISTSGLAPQIRKLAEDPDSSSASPFPCTARQTRFPEQDHAREPKVPTRRNSTGALRGLPVANATG